MAIVPLRVCRRCVTREHNAEARRQPQGRSVAVPRHVLSRPCGGRGRSARPSSCGTPLRRPSGGAPCRCTRAASALCVHAAQRTLVVPMFLIQQRITHIFSLCLRAPPHSSIIKQQIYLSASSSPSSPLNFLSSSSSGHHFRIRRQTQAGSGKTTLYRPLV